MPIIDGRQTIGLSVPVTNAWLVVIALAGEALTVGSCPAADPGRIVPARINKKYKRANSKVFTFIFFKQASAGLCVAIL